MSTRLGWRRLVPWWVIEIIDRLNVYCWADLVWWWYGSESGVRRNVRCVKAMVHEGRSCVTCYCGYWDRIDDDRRACEPAAVQP